jgi:hypothetical protein
LRDENGRLHCGGEKMQDDEMVISSIAATVMGAVLLAIVFGLGCFVYGDINGGLAMMLLCVTYAALTALAAIPVIGVFVQGYVILSIAWPAISRFGMIEANWLTTLIFIVYILAGILFTITTTKIAIRGH